MKIKKIFIFEPCQYCRHSGNIVVLLSLQRSPNRIKNSSKTAPTVKLFLMKKNSFSGLASADASSSFVVRVKRYRWAIIWCTFHLCALFLSYNEIRFFNATGEPKTDRFWPFVKFTYPYFLPDDNTTYFKL